MQDYTRDSVCKALVTAFLDRIPMPKNEDHSDVVLGPVLDDFQPVKSDPRVQKHDNDSLRLLEEQLRVACTTTPPDDDRINAAADNLREAVGAMEPDMRAVIDEALTKKGRTLEWARVMTAGDMLFRKVYRSVFETISESEDKGIERYRKMIAQLQKVLPGGKAPLQRPDTLVALYQEAAGAQPGFKAAMKQVQDLFQQTTGYELELKVCPKLKKVTRILEKMIMRGSVRGVKDIVRAMSTVNTMDEVAIVGEVMLELHSRKAIKLLRMKERFFQQPSSGGWRGGYRGLGG